MSALFGESATRLCSAACQLLGWRPNEFWNATPTELATALQLPNTTTESLEPGLIEELRRRFPDN